jgi:hypothetical protein
VAWRRAATYNGAPRRRALGWTSEGLAKLSLGRLESHPIGSRQPSAAALAALFRPSATPRGDRVKIPRGRSIAFDVSWTLRTHRRPALARPLSPLRALAIDALLIRRA